MIARRWLTLGVALVLATPGVVRAQARAPRSELITSETTLSPRDTSTWPKKFHIGTNEFNLGFTTLIIGGGYLQDYAS